MEACQLLKKKEKSKLEEYVKNMSPAFLSSIVRQLVRGFLDFTFNLCSLLWVKITLTFTFCPEVLMICMLLA